MSPASDRCTFRFLSSEFNVRTYKPVWDVEDGCGGDSESLSSIRLGLWDSVCSVCRYDICP